MQSSSARSTGLFLFTKYSKVQQLVCDDGIQKATTNRKQKQTKTKLENAITIAISNIIIIIRLQCRHRIHHMKRASVKKEKGNRYAIDLFYACVYRLHALIYRKREMGCIRTEIAIYSVRTEIEFCRVEHNALPHHQFNGFTRSSKCTYSTIAAAIILFVSQMHYSS